MTVSMFEIRFSDILGMTLYILIYLNFTAREGNQSDDDYVKPKQKKQKHEDGKYMVCSSSSFMRQKTWHVLIIIKDVLKCPNTTITILTAKTLVFEGTGTVVSRKYTPPCA